MINKQEYANYYEQNITIVRGDTMIFEFALIGLEGESPSMAFKVTNDYNKTALFSENTDNGGITLESYDSETDEAVYAVRVAPEDTINLTVGRYYYDLVMEENEDVYTLQRGAFDIEYEVK